MNRLASTLACSGLLAARQQAIVPDLPLAWNPRDDMSTLHAVEAFLSHVAATVFPVNTWVSDLDTATEYLTHIPLIGQGFSYWYEAPFDELTPGIHHLLLIILTLENNLDDNRESAYAAYLALRELGFEEVVPLFKIYVWLEECISGKRPFPDDLLKEGPEHWQGFVSLMRYLSNDTGYELSDFAEDEEEDLFLEMELDWLDTALVERYRTGWIKAQLLLEQISIFVGWTQADWGNYLRVQEVMITICREVWREWGEFGKSSPWNLDALTKAYEEMDHMYDGWYEDEEE